MTSLRASGRWSLMSRWSLMIGAGIVLVAAGGIVSVLEARSAHPGGPAQPSIHMAALPSIASVETDDEKTALPTDAAIYGPNSGALALAAAKAAAAIPQLSGSGAWHAAGPFGVDFYPNVANGAEKLGPVAGIGTALAVDPSDASGNTAFLGTHGGLYVTHDGGKTVTNLSDGKLPRTAIGALAIDPAHPRTLYVGTGVSLLTISDDATGTGVYVSRDGGRTFARPAANVGGYGVNVIVVTPTAVLVGTNTGLYRSTDQGLSFVAVPLPTNAAHTAPGPQPFGSWVSAIAVKPGVPDEVTVAVGFAFGHKLGPTKQPLALGNGLYRSTAAGAPGTFRYLRTAAAAFAANPVASSDPIGRVSLAYGSAPGQQNTLWALVQDAGYADNRANLLGLPDVPDVGGLGINPVRQGELNGLFRSTDDGSTWTVQATVQTLLASLNSTENGLAALGEYPGVQASYNNWVLTDPIDPNRVYVGLEEAYEGEYGAVNPTAGALGLNFPLLTKFQVMERYADPCGFYTSITSGLVGGTAIACPDLGTGLYSGNSTHPDQHVAQIVKTAGGERIYSGNDGGFFVEDSSRQLDGLLATGSLRSFSNNGWRPINNISTTLPYHAAFWSGGRLLVGLQDNGTAWVTPDGKGTEVCGGDGVDVFPGPTPDSLFCTHPNDSVEYVTGNGANTVLISPTTIGPWGLTPMAQDSAAPAHLIIGGRDVQELTTLGDASPLNQLAGAGQGSATWTTVYDAGKSSVKGIDWQASAFTISGALAYVGTCGACRATYGDTSTIHSTLLTDVKPGCVATYGTAKCWHTTAGHGLPKRRIAGVAFDPAHPETVYVGLQDVSLIGYDPHIVGTQRVMVSHDGGTSFTDISGNLPLTNINQVLLRDGRLLAATDVGVFTSVVGSSTWMRLGSNLPAITVRDIRLDPTGTKMVAAVFGRGAYVYSFGSPAHSGTGVVPPAERHATTLSGQSAGTPASGRASAGDVLAAAVEPDAATPIFVGLLLVVLGVEVRRRQRTNARRKL
jgi:hypothetical protein